MFREHVMPCHITDGPQYDDERPEPEDEDEAYERFRSQEIDVKIAPNNSKEPQC